MIAKDNVNIKSKNNIAAANDMVQALNKILDDWAADIKSKLQVKHESVKSPRAHKVITHFFSTSLDVGSQSQAAKRLRKELSDTLKTYKNKMIFNTSLLEDIILLINDFLEKLGFKKQLNTSPSLSFFGSDTKLNQGINLLEKSLKSKEIVYGYEPEINFNFQHFW